MNLLQALRYFFKEAVATAVGNWRASAVAIATCALSLYVGAFFFLVTGNLSQQTESWQRSLKISVYLDDGVRPAGIESVRTLVSEPAWIETAEYISVEQARQRFRGAFPQVATALGDTDTLDLPASIEGAILVDAIDETGWEVWIDELVSMDGVSGVDDDRSWVREVQRLSLWVRSAGLAISLGLLVAAAFTIAAVVRLTAYRYLDEISVLRLVGATEFFVRGPFVVEGFLQGLAGGLLAIGGLWCTHLIAAAQTADSLWMTIVFDRFLSGASQGIIVLIGAAAGLIGSVLSIRRESLEVLDEEPVP